MNAAPVAAILRSVAAAAPGNVLINGDFSQGELRHNWTALYVGSHAIVGWRVLAPVDYVSSAYWQTADSSRSVDLDGTPGPGAIAQTFATVPGDAYKVRFELAANTEGPPRTKRVRVTAAGTTRSFWVDVDGRSNGAMRYKLESLTFVAHSRSATLEFASLSRPGNWNGAVITGVVVREISDRLWGETANRIEPSPESTTTQGFASGFINLTGS
ncbi:MAG: choice-of-anchor C family protein [Candidatus Eremiobacteraeota bacterium]|nr:choice-of-anchor C family protein [Candidatus Eremiobacteraeota bacterium]